MNKENIIKNLEKIVNRHVKSYKDDFYDYDINTILDSKRDDYIFIVRECGSYLFPIESFEDDNKRCNCSRIVTYYQMTEPSHKFFLISGGKSKMIRKHEEQLRIVNTYC